MVVNLISPNGRYDKLYIDNYAYLQVKDALARVRAWATSPSSARAITACESGSTGKSGGKRPHRQRCRERDSRTERAGGAGIIGQPPMTHGVPFQFTVNAQGRLLDEQEFGDIVIKSGTEGQVTRVRDVARVELAARDYSTDSKLNGQPMPRSAFFQLPGRTRSKRPTQVRATMKKLKEHFRQGSIIGSCSTRPALPASRFAQCSTRWLKPCCWSFGGGDFFAKLARLNHSAAGGAGFAHRHFWGDGRDGFSLNNLSLFGLVLAIGIVVDDAIVVVENVERTSRKAWLRARPRTKR